MAGNVQGVRAGRVYVEVGATDGPMRAVLKAAEAKVGAFGRAVNSIGSGFKGVGAGLSGLGRSAAGIGLAVAAPLGLAAKGFSSYEDALANLRAAANPTAAELMKIEAAIADLSKSTGAGPARVAAAMVELKKAGLSVEQIIGGAARATLEFARVTEMDAAEAATVLTDAMNVFGADATTAVDTLSRAADASSISVRDVAMAFNQASAVAKMAGQSIGDTANTIAILGQNGVKGSDAGTSLKTMLLRLVAPAEEGAKMIKALGINVRDADGSMKSLPGIIGELQSKLSGLSGEARDKALKDIFGTDAIRAGTILLAGGVKGWNDFAAAMSQGLPVSSKYAVLMNTLGGSFDKVRASLERFAVEAGKALAPTLRAIGNGVLLVTDGLADFAKANGGTVVMVAGLAAGAVAAGVAVLGLGTVLSAAGSILATVAGGVGLVGAAIGLLASPLGLAVAGFAAWALKTGQLDGALKTLKDGFGSLKTDVSTAFQGVSDAMKGGDVGLAAKILWATVRLEWNKGSAKVLELASPWAGSVVDVFDGLRLGVMKTMTELWGDLHAGWVRSLGQLQSLLPSFDAALKGVFGPGAGFSVKDALKAGAGALNPLAQMNDPKVRGAIRGAIGGAAGAAEQANPLGAIEPVPEAEARAREIEAERDRQLAALDAQKPAGGQVNAAIQDALARAIAGQEGAQKELLGLLAEAKQKALDKAGESGGGAGGKQTLAQKADEVDRGLAHAKGKVDVSGSFSASAIAGLGVGDTLADEIKKQTKTGERTASAAETVAAAARRGKLVFTA